MIEFGTGGWRAIIGDGFTKANVQRLSLALSRRIKRDGVEARGLVIGYDRRFLSHEAAQWSAEVFAEEGVRVLVIDRDAPTPLVMYCVRRLELPYGMSVTASHNPAIYNGVKLFLSGGRDADEGFTRELQIEANALDMENVNPAPYDEALKAGRIAEINPRNDYLDGIISAVDMAKIRQANLSIVLDPMYGVSGTSLETILLTARCDVDIIHGRRDTLFGGRLPAPNSETLDALRMAVCERHADIGIATDGDADRLGIISDEGKFVHPNEILVLLYYYLLEYKGWRGAAVRNLATTHMLDRIAEAYGEKCIETPVGFKHISKAMDDHGALIGGESSGGLTVRGHILGKDGIYAATLLTEMLAISGEKLSSLLKRISDRFGSLYMAERDFAYRSSHYAEIRRLLTGDRFPKLSEEIASVNDLDGRKLLFRDGWMIARFSGTEPRIRIFCEMPTRARAERLCAEMQEYLGLN